MDRQGILSEDESEGLAPGADPSTLIRSRRYRVLLLYAGVVGIVVSAASWCFLEAVHQLEVWVYEDLPGKVGYDHAPEWWSLPWVALAGLLTAFAIARLPGKGGHVPAEGLKVEVPLWKKEVYEGGEEWIGRGS